MKGGIPPWKMGDYSHLSDEEYRKLWQNLWPLEVTMMEKTGKCPHELGEKHLYKSPYQKPHLCNALLHVLDLYVWRAALGFPSWEADNRNVYRIHCPSKKGTVWELKQADNKTDL